MAFTFDTGYLALIGILPGGDSTATDEALFTNIGFIENINPSTSFGEAEMGHNQAATPWKDFLPTFGEMTVGIDLAAFDPGSGEHEDTILDNLGLTHSFIILFNDSAAGTEATQTHSRWMFEGFYRETDVTIPTMDKMGGSLTIRVRNKPRFTGVA